MKGQALPKTGYAHWMRCKDCGRIVRADVRKAGYQPHYCKRGGGRKDN